MSKGNGGEDGGSKRPAKVGNEVVNRWSPRRKMEVVLRLLRGEPLDAVSRDVGVELHRLEAWRNRALAGMELSMKERGGDPLANELAQALRRVGELTMDNELLQHRARRAEGRAVPFPPKKSPR